MKCKMLFAVVAISTLGISQAQAETCSCESGATEGPETIVEAETTAGDMIRVRFAANPVTQTVRTAALCVESQTRVTMAKLWMPDMGHGSSPTRLTEMTPGCTKVERINFLMEGAWEIRVTLDGGDKGTLAVEVEE